MGYKQFLGLIVALVLLAVVTPLAYGQVQLQLNVTARMCCTFNGNCPPGLPVPRVQGAALNMSCMTPVGMVNWGVTPEQADRALQNGILLNLTIDLNEVPDFSPPMCVVTANLPANTPNCPILNTGTGTLVGMALPASPIPFSPTVVSNTTVNLDVPFFIRTNASIITN